VTEAEPTIKLYDEARWAELEDARSAPVELSLALFDSLRQLCLQFFQSLSPADWSHKFYHPERGVLAGKTRSPRLPGTAGITQLLSRNWEKGWAGRKPGRETADGPTVMIETVMIEKDERSVVPVARGADASA